MTCTVDASVFVAAARPSERQFPASREFLRQLRARAVGVQCPTLVLPECAGAIARPTSDVAAAEQTQAMIQGFPDLQLVGVDVSLAQRAAQIATKCRLRGSDAVYVAVAEKAVATLVTWDAEMLQRAPAIVPTMTPAEWMARQTPNP